VRVLLTRRPYPFQCVIRAMQTTFGLRKYVLPKPCSSFSPLASDQSTLFLRTCLRGEDPAARSPDLSPDLLLVSLFFRQALFPPDWLPHGSKYLPLTKRPCSSFASWNSAPSGRREIPHQSVLGVQPRLLFDVVVSHFGSVFFFELPRSSC